MKANKVLISSFYFPPVNSPGTQHPTWFFRFLRDYGFETVALTSSVYVAENLTADPLQDPGILDLPQGSLLKRLAFRLYQMEMVLQSNRGYWEHGFVWSRLFAQPAARRLLRRDNFAAMISVSPSIASHWNALCIKRAHPDLKWIADYQDPVVGNPYRLNEGSPFDRKLERAIFSNADCLSANTDGVAAMWREMYPEFRDKVAVTWGGYDPDERIDPQPLASQTPVLSHVGGLYGPRLPTALLQSLDRLISSGRLKPGDLVLEFVGNVRFGPMESLANRLIEQGWLRVRNEYIPRAEALRIAGQAHYSLLLDVSEKGLFVPGKLFDQVRVGRPILAFTPPDSPAERILGQSGIPYISLAPYNTQPDEVDAAVLRLLDIAPAQTQPSPWFTETFDARRLAGLMAKRIRGGDSNL
jgi:hypothetical protein